MTDWVFYIAGAAFIVAGILALYRIARGPKLLDRMIAADMMLTTLLCAVGAEMVYNGHTHTLPIMIVLGATSFLGAVVVARHVSRSAHDDT